MSPLGAGGMGEVYRAHDPSLERDVALKVLPDALADESERLQRFEREAKALGSLNHPNIAQVFGFEQLGDVRAIVMELVEGPTLEEAIREKSEVGNQESDVDAVEWALPIAVQVARALEAAHDAGVIHRDLKPANIKVREDGTVKVLDFGLAKAFDPAAPSSGTSSHSNSPTMTSPATGLGVILGTAAYMSPEQARGRSVDRRADVWSFGVVLFEMLTGRRLFGPSSASRSSGAESSRDEDTVSDTLAAVLRQEVPWDRLPDETPAPLRRLLRRCLERDPQKRLRDIGDARLELEYPDEDAADAQAARPAARGRRPLGVATVVAVGLALVSGVVMGRWFWSPAPSNETGWTHFTQLTDASGVEDEPVIAPSGELVAYVSTAAGSADIYVQRVGGRAATLVAGSPDRDEVSPAFSPDGQRIAYALAPGGGIFVAGATGESARRLTDEGFHPAWSPDGSRVAYCTDFIRTPYSRNFVSSLWVVNVDDPSAAPTKLTDGDAVQPAWSPSGGRIAFWANDGGQRDLFTIAATGTGGERVPVLQDAALDWSVTWSPDGEYLYFSSDRGGSLNLWRVAIDEATGLRRGEPEPVTSGVQAQIGYASISADGRRIVFRSQLESINPVAVPFDPVSLELGEPRFLSDQTGLRMPTDVSPDGRWLLHQNVGERPEDIFISGIDGTGMRRLTDDEYRDRQAVWAPDGATLAFESNRSGQWALWGMEADGGGLELLAEVPGEDLGIPTYGPDGDAMYVASLVGHSYRFDLTGDRTAQPETLGPFNVPPIYPIASAGDGRRLLGVTEGAWLASVVDLDSGTATVSEIAVPMLPAWLPGDRRVIAMNTSGRLIVWHLASGTIQMLAELPFDALAPEGSVVVAPDGRTLYLGGRQRQADIWMLERDR